MSGSVRSAVQAADGLSGSDGPWRAALRPVESRAVALMIGLGSVGDNPQRILVCAATFTSVTLK